MSTTGNFHSRVVAMLNTWARQHWAKLEIFTAYNDSALSASEKAFLLEQQINIITLPNVSDAMYPPQKKSFSMLKYIYDNHLDE